MHGDDRRVEDVVERDINTADSADGPGCKSLRKDASAPVKLTFLARVYCSGSPSHPPVPYRCLFMEMSIKLCRPSSQ
jgi:hypothetical protein